MKIWMSVLVLSMATLAHAQEAAAPGAETQHAEDVATRHDEDDVRVMISAGTSLTYGNARNLSINLAGELALRMDEHAFMAQAGWIYGMAALRDPVTMEHGDFTESANNATWRVRYDYFLTLDDAIFGVVKGRYDPFAQLTPRIGVQVGYMRNFLREENHRFWGEVGYDFTYDLFPEPLTVSTDDMGMPVLSSDRALHSLRLFVGYDNRINEILNYTMGLEALMRFDRPEHWRFEWVHQFRSKIMEWLQISLDVTGRFDSLPPGQEQAWDERPMQPTQMFDLIITLNIVGTFDLYTEAAAAEEEACEPCVCPEPTPCPPVEEEATPEPPAEEPAAEEPAAEEPVEAEPETAPIE